MSRPLFASRKRANLWRVRWRLVAAVGLAVLLVPLTAWAADGVSLRVIDGNGTEDPVEDVARTFVFEGTSGAPGYLYVKYRAAGGAPCAPSAASDVGEGFLSGEPVNGNFRFARADTWRDAGQVLFCMWIAPNSESVVTPFSRVVTFRVPNGSVSISTNPSVLRPRVPGTITVSGSSEAPRALYVKYRPAGGAPCAPSPASDSGDRYTSESVNGAFSFTQAIAFERPGSYVFCAWLREHSEDVEAVGGTPQPFSVVVQAPPPACVVPRLRGKTVRAARNLLRRAHCSVGTIRRVRNRRIARGRIVRSSPPAGARRPNGTLVALFVSRGR